jgi:PAS domain S-box-containing protein
MGSPARPATIETIAQDNGLVGLLEEQVVELRAALEEAAEAICRTDAAGRLISVNRAFSEMFGYTATEIMGRSWEEVIAPEDRAPVRADREAGVRARIERQALGLRRDGTSFAMHLVMVPLFSRHDGHPVVQGHYFYVRDLTERRRTEEQLILAGRMAAVGTLAAGVAHEINNPLAYIVANIDFSRRELVRQGAARPGAAAAAPALPAALADSLGEILEALDEAREGAERVRNIVRDLKVFGRGNEAARGPVALRRVLDSSINIAWSEIRHRARLVKDYGDEPLIEGNESRLGQVFLNLLLNAAQAIAEGAADRNEIRVSTGTDRVGRAVIEVRDSGLGIPPEIVARIFDPFFTTKPEGVGTGLGLWICKGILSGLGGEISVESQLGHGSTFRVTLPAASAGEPGERPERAPAEAERRAERVLIIDDEPMILGALQRALGGEYRVTCLSDGREALARFAAGERYDVILCDLMMPDTNGMELHAAIDRLAPGQGERMIFVTGGAFTPRAREFLDRVPNPRIDKPVDFQNLRVLMKNLLG